MGTADKFIRVGVVGATGYSGLELVRLLSAHPSVRIAYLAASRDASNDLRSDFPFLSAIGNNSALSGLPEGSDSPWSVVAFDADICADRCDVVFVALPSGLSGSVAIDLWRNGCRVIDLSGDLRLCAADYEQWYQRPAVDTIAQRKAVYGLTEWQRDQIAGARLVANPGCFATAALLALLPAVRSGLWGGGPIVIDAKSGVSGAGRQASAERLFGEISENLFAYRLGRHQHTPEVEQQLQLAGDAPVTVLLTAQVAPMTRGIFACSYLRLAAGVDVDAVQRVYGAAYADAPFVHLVGRGKSPAVKDVRGSNACHLGWHVEERSGMLQVLSAIDNLQKGAAGQAVQNMNVMFGLAETAALSAMALWP